MVIFRSSCSLEKIVIAAYTKFGCGMVLLATFNFIIFFRIFPGHWGIVWNKLLELVQVAVSIFFYFDEIRKMKEVGPKNMNY